jgi:serine/threonine-protein kinase
VVAGRVVFVSGRALYAFDTLGETNCAGDPKTCDPLWTASPAGPSDDFGDPAVVGGVVYVSSVDPGGGAGDALYAFDAAGETNCSGDPKACGPLWTAPIGADVFSSPTVAGGIVYVPSDDGLVYAFDAAGNTNCSGTPKACAPLWTATLAGNNQNHSSPAVAGGVLYATTAHVAPTGEEASGVSAFDAAGATNCSGTPKACTPLWTARLPDDDATLPPAVANGVVYVVDKLGRVNALDANTGTTLWIAPADATFASLLAVANGRVYVGSGHNGVRAFDAAGTTNCSGSPKTCTALWTGATGGPVGAASVAHGVVYVGSFDRKLYAFDAAGGGPNCSASGTVCFPLWTATTGGAILSSPAVANGGIYVASDKLYAFRVET